MSAVEYAVPFAALTARDAATGAVLRRTALAVGGPVLEYGRPAAAVVLFGDEPRGHGRQRAGSVH
ncbi:hypothetical protein ACFWG6_11890 [Streptomyces erythrochromogenes]|uniref:hypothetical protein n=1 Tax=Streptomyces erythrochromogenes TaxID=285574 RepID=UPI00363423A2